MSQTANLGRAPTQGGVDSRRCQIAALIRLTNVSLISIVGPKQMVTVSRNDVRRGALRTTGLEWSIVRGLCCHE